MGIDTPPRYEEDGIVYYRASALGMCDRIFAAMTQGYEPMSKPEWFQTVLDEGTRMETKIRDKFIEDTGLTVIEDQREVRIEILDDVFIVGHIDGLTEDEEVPDNVWEGKKFRPSTWEKFLRSGVECLPYYPIQSAIYMHALREEFDSDVGLHFTGGLYNEDKDTIDEVYTHHYIDPPVPLLAIKKRVAKLEAIINDGIHVMDVKCAKPAMYPCPFYFLHDADDTVEPATRPGDDVIAPLIREWASFEDERLSLDRRSREIATNLKRIKDGIVGWCEASGVEDGQTAQVEIDDKTYEVRVLSVYRKGYVANPTTYNKVTFKAPDEPNPPAKKAAGKKAPAKKVAAKKLAGRKP